MSVLKPHKNIILKHIYIIVAYKLSFLKITIFIHEIILIYFLFHSMYKKIVIQIKRSVCSYNQKFEKLQM